MSFLTAEWRRLAFANYAIDPAILKPYVPYKTELDSYKGKTYVSLVGFLFKDVKIKGIKVPFHTQFEEINLRFYVRYRHNGIWKRGVVFIKETVPKPAITFVANTLYKEHYETSPMQYKWEDTNHSMLTEYKLKKGGNWHSISVKSTSEMFAIEENSEEEFITEHYWGYSDPKPNKTIEYEVTHPKWQLYKVTDYSVDFDFGLVHGEIFAFLNKEKPTTVFLANGSPITIESKNVIR